MNLHNFKNQTLMNKAAIIITVPFAFGIHWMEWRRMRKLKRMIRKWIGAACKNPQGIEAEMVKEWSDELRVIYGK